VRQPEYGGHQHVEHLLLILHGVVEERSLEAEAGVVDEQVDAVGDAGLDLRQLGAHREVRCKHLDLHAVLLPQPRRQLGQPPLVAGDQHQLVAALGEPAGERMTDPGGRAGDQGGG
jgi:hypothetical protein